MGNHSDIGLLVAFAAGLISFLSPCVAPLVPGYLALISGSTVSGDTMRTRPVNWRLVGTSASFVAGFSLVFIALGASAASLGGLVDAHRSTMIQVSGGMMILMGFTMLGALRLPWLLRERRWHREPRNFSASESVLLGMAFGFGWTPCFGPILATVLTYASTGETARQGTALLTAYALGLGLPFVLIGIGVGSFTHLGRLIRSANVVLAPLSGLTLIGLGLLFVTDRFFFVSIASQRFYYTLMGG